MGFVNVAPSELYVLDGELDSEEAADVGTADATDTTEVLADAALFQSVHVF